MRWRGDSSCEASTTSVLALSTHYDRLCQESTLLILLKHLSRFRDTGNWLDCHAVDDIVDYSTRNGKLFRISFANNRTHFGTKFLVQPALNSFYSALRPEMAAGTVMLRVNI